MLILFNNTKVRKCFDTVTNLTWQVATRHSMISMKTRQLLCSQWSYIWLQGDLMVPLWLLFSLLAAKHSSSSCQPFLITLARVQNATKCTSKKQIIAKAFRCKHTSRCHSQEIIADLLVSCLQARSALSACIILRTSNYKHTLCCPVQFCWALIFCLFRICLSL